MTSRETFECRTYMAEDAMYQRVDSLERDLHDLESDLRDLIRFVHHVLCEGGSMPLHQRAHSIADAVEAFQASNDLTKIRSSADRISSLEGLIDGFEGELAQNANPAPTSEYQPVLEAVAAASWSR